MIKDIITIPNFELIYLEDCVLVCDFYEGKETRYYMDFEEVESEILKIISEKK